MVDKKFTYIHETMLSEKYWGEVVVLLFICADEFVTSLHSRTSTTQVDFQERLPSSIEPYFSKIKEQSCILVSESNDMGVYSDSSIVGFLSYIKGYSVKDFNVPVDNIYVSTFCIAPFLRREGLAETLFKKIEDMHEGSFMFTRTWNSNFSCISLLRKRGFRLLHTIKNDRDDGIDTVYYGKVLNGAGNDSK